jgi:hypothetical protein
MNKQLVIKSNALIEASYRLSSIEQKIILTLATKIKKDDKEFREYYFNLRSMANFLGLNSNSDYDYLREVTRNLLSKVIEIKTEDALLQTHWLESVKYFDNNSTVELRFNPELKPFLLQLKKNFTKYQLKYAIQLKSKFSIRIYELLKQYEGIGSRLLSLEDLREYLGIRADEYSLYGDFKRKVLKVAQKELNAKTDISFNFEEIKTGRKVTDLKLIIVSSKKPETTLDPSADINEQDLFSLAQSVEKQSDSLRELVSLLPAEYRNKKSIEKILKADLEKHGFDYVARNIEYTNKNSNATKPGANLTRGSNYRNYLAKALKSDFGLAYQEDLEAQKLKEQQKESEIAQQERQKKQEQEKINRERELSSKARQLFETMSQEEQKEVELAAVAQLPPELQEIAQKNRFAAQFAINRAMEKVIIEKHLSKDNSG